jgi:catechol 2,3-dioxygenase-like lactoylglutathione lyase family enzyme
MLSDATAAAEEASARQQLTRRYPRGPPQIILGLAHRGGSSRRSTMPVTAGGGQMASISVRYIVDNVAAAIAFYCEQLDFHLVMHPAPTFAMLDRDELRLVLSAPSNQGGGGQAMPDGTKPEPGGWNRFVIEVTDLADRVELLRRQCPRTSSLLMLAAPSARDPNKDRVRSERRLRGVRVRAPAEVGGPAPARAPQLRRGVLCARRIRRILRQRNDS